MYCSWTCGKRTNIPTGCEDSCLVGICSGLIVGFQFCIVVSTFIEHVSIQRYVDSDQLDESCNISGVLHHLWSLSSSVDVGQLASRKLTAKEKVRIEKCCPTPPYWSTKERPAGGKYSLQLSPFLVKPLAKLAPGWVLGQSSPVASVLWLAYLRNLQWHPDWLKDRSPDITRRLRNSSSPRQQEKIQLGTGYEFAHNTDKASWNWIWVVGVGERTVSLSLSFSLSLSLSYFFLSFLLFLSFFLSFFLSLSLSLSLSFFLFPSFYLFLKGKGKNSLGKKREKGKQQTVDFCPELTRDTHRAHGRTTRNNFLVELTPQSPIVIMSKLKLSKPHPGTILLRCI